MTLTTPPRTTTTGLLVSGGAAVAAIAVNHLLPVVSPLLIALAIGVLITNSPLSRQRWMLGQGQIGRTMLRCGVVLLGLKLPFDAIVSIGPAGLLVIVATVAATYAGTIFAGRRLGLEHGIVTLVATGFSICGAAAIAAVEDVVRGRKSDVGLAVALVTVFGTAMIAVIPAASAWIGLSETTAAMWAGASIHEVAQVAAAGSVLGSGALAIAMTVKLGRVLLLAPVYTWTARREDRSGGSVPLVPWFVVGFIALVAVRSTTVVPRSALDVTDVLTTLLLAAGMFGLGLGIRAADLWPLSGRVLLLATISTAIAAGTSLALILLLTT